MNHHYYCKCTQCWRKKQNYNQLYYLNNRLNYNRPHFHKPKRTWETTKVKDIINIIIYGKKTIET